MAKNLPRYVYDGAFAENAINITNQNNEQLKEGVIYESPIVSTNLNDFLKKITIQAQYGQFTGGLYSQDAKYDNGNFCSLVVHWYIEVNPNEYLDKYELLWFMRTEAQAQLSKNYLPIDATLYTKSVVNGVDVYLVDSWQENMANDGYLRVNQGWRPLYTITCLKDYMDKIKTNTQLQQHIDNQATAHGQTPEPVGGKIISRDADGYAKVKAPPEGARENDHIVNFASLLMAASGSVTQLIRTTTYTSGAGTHIPLDNCLFMICVGQGGQGGQGGGGGGGGGNGIGQTASVRGGGGGGGGGGIGGGIGYKLNDNRINGKNGFGYSSFNNGGAGGLGGIDGSGNYKDGRAGANGGAGQNGANGFVTIYEFGTVQQGGGN